MKYYLIIPFLILLVGCLQPEKNASVFSKSIRETPFGKIGLLALPDQTYHQITQYKFSIR